MKILTIIVTYNAMPWAARCFGSLTRSALPTDVMVIDNGSTDGTQQYVAQHYPQFAFVQSPQNLGFGQANNMGLRRALQESYDAVCLLNQDAWLEPNALTTLANAATRQPEYGIISPLQLTADEQMPEQGFGIYTGLKHLDQLPQTEVAEAPFINAAIWYMPASTLRTVGLFAPLFFHYGEDKDYVNRLHYHGLKMGYAPEARGVHDRAQRKSSREALLRADYVYLLSEYANINRTVASAFAHSVLAALKKSAQALTQGEAANATAFVQMAGRLLWQSKAVSKTRKQSKKTYLP